MKVVASMDLTIESYLAQVGTELRGLPKQDINDILRELRSHVVELSGEEEARTEDALRSLGDPVDLAKTYRAESMLARAECAGSPLTILQGLRRASRTGLGRIVVSALYIFGYANVLTLWAAAVEKLFAPARTGLWYASGTAWPLWLVTDGNGPSGSRELLGWWFVPAAIAAGWVLRYLADRTAQWWIRRYRRSSSNQEA